MKKPKFQVGQKVWSDFEQLNIYKEVTIKAVSPNTASQSGITYQVEPPMKGYVDAWYDQAWFHANDPRNHTTYKLL